MTQTADHDVFTCECHETCSWCADPFPITQLGPFTYKGDTWEMICHPCQDDHKREDW